MHPAQYPKKSLEDKNNRFLYKLIEPLKFTVIRYISKKTKIHDLLSLER